MSVSVILANERGQTNLDWLKSYHAFSFGNYYHPNRNNFGSLLVLNDDIVSPGKGFSKHSHQNAEIVSIVLSGSLKHTDSEGHTQVVNAFELQRTTAGKGIWHSEENLSQTEPVHFLQLWFKPNVQNLTPSYEHESFSLFLLPNVFTPLVSGRSGIGLSSMNQDATISMGQFEIGNRIIPLNLRAGYGIYLYVIDGSINYDGKNLGAGSSLEITRENLIALTIMSPTKLLAVQTPIDSISGDFR